MRKRYRPGSTPLKPTAFVPGFSFKVLTHCPLLLISAACTGEAPLMPRTGGTQLLARPWCTHVTQTFRAVTKGHHRLTSFSPAMLAIKVNRKNTRQKSAGSLKSKMPTMAVPMAPMPVHTA